MDYFFTTLPLLEKLTHMDMYWVSTIQENRLQEAPLEKKAALQKETRGTYDYTSDGKNLLIAWRELPETKLPLLPPLFVAKSSFVKKVFVGSWEKELRIPMPYTFKEYNADMKGVDLFDWFVSTYCVRNSSKNWWWPFFAWSINATTVSYWRWFRKIHRNKLYC